MLSVTEPIASMSKTFSVLLGIVLLGIFVVSGCSSIGNNSGPTSSSPGTYGSPTSGAAASPSPTPDDRSHELFPWNTTTDSLPLFWPPPKASADHEIPRDLIVAGKISEPTWGKVAARMEQALKANGYSAFRYYAAPKGFALVTQLERINTDATPAKQRWEEPDVVQRVRIGAFSLDAYLNALLGRDAGLFRVIAFMFTPEPIVMSVNEPSISEAKSWIKEGRWIALPADLSGQVYGEDVRCTALIYEFEVPRRGAPAILRIPSIIPGQRHLEAAKILQALQQ